jgi:hypothetical protein
MTVDRVFGWSVDREDGLGPSPISIGARKGMSNLTAVRTYRGTVPGRKLKIGIRMSAGGRKAETSTRCTGLQVAGPVCLGRARTRSPDSDSPTLTEG